MERAIRNRLLILISILGCAAALAWAVLSGIDRAYLYASLIILALILIPFYISFEKDRPYARQIVLVSVMTALAVASRAAFFWVPQFKPIIAVIIISGAGLGAQSGFVVGSMSAFVSNFLFGQGPWTPFQMTAWGLIGMLAGLLFCRVYSSSDSIKVAPLMIYGAVSCFLLHGAITDIWTVLSVSDRPTAGQFITVYSAGLIPDLILAAATVLFLGAATRPMLKKINRVKMKYGI